MKENYKKEVIMKLTFVESIPKRTRKGGGSKYVALLSEFIDSEGTTAIVEDCSHKIAPYIRSLACKNSIPVNVITVGGSVYFQK